MLRSILLHAQHGANVQKTSRFMRDSNAKYVRQVSACMPFYAVPYSAWQAPATVDGCRQHEHG